MSVAVRAEELAVGWPEGFTQWVRSWEVPTGAMAGVLGPSGSGKTTLLSALAGERAPLAGELWVLGEPLHRLDEASRRAWRVRCVGRVLQDFQLLEGLSVWDNVLLPYRLHDELRIDRAVRARAEALLASLGVDMLRERLPHALSQGQRHRVAVARALVTQPGLILADEPTTGLDPLRKAAVMTLLERSGREQGATLLLVTHDPSIASRCDPTLTLEEP